MRVGHVKPTWWADTDEVNVIQPSHVADMGHFVRWPLGSLMMFATLATAAGTALEGGVPEGWAVCNGTPAAGALKDYWMSLGPNYLPFGGTTGKPLRPDFRSVPRPANTAFCIFEG